MKKTTLIYVIMLLVCGGGLWGILRHGSTLSAVADLSGDWTIESDSGPLGPGSAGPEHLGDSFHVEQSGRFFRIRFASGRQLDLRAAAIPLADVGTTPAAIALGDSRWNLKGTVQQKESQLVGTFTLQGPRPAQFVAYRTPRKSDEPPPVSHDLDPVPAVPEGPTTQATALRGATRPMTQPLQEKGPPVTAVLPASSDLSVDP